MPLRVKLARMFDEGGGKSNVFSIVIDRYAAWAPLVAGVARSPQTRSPARSPRSAGPAGRAGLVSTDEIPLPISPAPNSPPAGPGPGSGWLDKLGVAALMALAAVVMTWPLAAEMRTAVNDFGDPLLNSWILWWDVKALTTPGLSLFNAPIFHPAPLTLAYSEHLLTSALTVSPWLLAGGDAVVAHNLMFLLSYVLAGLGAYLLVVELTGSRLAGLVAGLGFAFAPFRFGHLGHLQNQTAHFMPWVLLYLHRWARAPRWRAALLFGLFWVLQMLSCGYYALYISLAVGLFLAFYFVAGRWWRQKKRWLQVAVVMLGVLVVVGPLFLPYIKVKKEMGFARSLNQAATYSAQPANYLASPPANRLYGQATTRFRGDEGELLLGATLSLLVLAGLLLPAGGPPAGRASAWLLALALALALGGCMVFLGGGDSFKLGSMKVDLTRAGPLLWAALAALALWRAAHLGGPRAAWSQGPRKILGLAWPPALDRTQVFYLILALGAAWASLGPHWGLYALLYYLVPGFDTMRVPARMAVLTTLAWAVLAGVGAARLQAYWRDRPGLMRWGLILACALILLESCSAPYPWARIPAVTPPAYQWLAAQPGPQVVMEIPTLGFRDDLARDARYLFWSTKHGHTLINGYSGFFPRGYLDLAASANRLPGDPGALAELRRRGANFLVVHLKEYPLGQRQVILDRFKAIGELKLVYNDTWTFIFRLQPQGPTK